MTFLPDGALLVTEKRGALKLLTAGGRLIDVAGVPDVAYGKQGGLGDVVLHPGFADNGLVYLSYAEAGSGGSGAAVARARLARDGDDAELTGLEVVWRQEPKLGGEGHYGHRIAFGPKGYLWISSGERQKFDPSQDMQPDPPVKECVPEIERNFQVVKVLPDSICGVHHLVGYLFCLRDIGGDLEGQHVTHNQGFHGQRPGERRPADGV